MRDRTREHWVDLLTDVICGVWKPHPALRKAFHFAHACGRGIRFPLIYDRLAGFVNELPQQCEIIEKPKSDFVFYLNRFFLNPEFRWPEELDRAGLLRFMPAWSERPIRGLLKRHGQAPDEPRWQQRLYALCLMVTVFAVKNGYACKE